MYKGIFWKIIDLDNTYLYSVKNECNANGDILVDGKFVDKKDYILNHKKCWENVRVNNKPFNYYPRGRVEIKNGICKIFLTPFLCSNEEINAIKKEFEINDSELKKIHVIVDNSFHYQYLMDI